MVHDDVPGHWKEFAEMYRKELETSDKTSEFYPGYDPVNQ